MRLTRNAFTLVEMLVVVAIIAVVVTVPLLAYNSLTRNARDGRRKQDMDKVNTALQQFRADTGNYPIADDWEELGESLVPNYMASLPEDPLSNNSAYRYSYESDPTGKSFSLSAGLEDREGGQQKVYVVTPNGPLTVTGTPPLPSATLPPGGGSVTPPFMLTGTGNPYPTDTPRATATRRPSRTPTPTRTPTPSNSPTPTPTPLYQTETYMADSGILDMVRGSDGNNWYITDAFTPQAGSLNLTTEAISGHAMAGCGYVNDIVSTTGKVWIASSLNKICSLNTSGVLVDSFTVSTVGNTSITYGSDNNIWFSAMASNMVYRMNPANGTTTGYAVTAPKLLAASPGYIWYASYSGGSTTVGRINVTNGTVAALDSYGGEPMDMVVVGTSAFVAINDNYILQFDTGGNTYLLPVPWDRVLSITQGTGNDIWFTGTAGATAQLGAIDTVSQTDIGYWEIPSMGMADPYSVMVDSATEIWYTTGRYIYKLTFN